MKKVLIVDDSNFMRITLRLLLERNGFEIIGEAENGKVAIEKYVELKPDIVTMDITMPIMNGITAVGIIMSLDKNAKIIMVSAIGQKNKVVDAINAGAKNFILKPFEEDFVIKTIKNY